MSLLRRIQDATIDPAYQLSDVLRMCKILAARLDYPDFKDWIENELNGYDEIEKLPDYRILTDLSLCGNFFGPFGSQARNIPIPLSIFPEAERKDISIQYVLQSIREVEYTVNKSSHSLLKSFFPPEIASLLYNKVISKMNCVELWREIPTSNFFAILDTVKSKILDFVLEIEKIAPDAGEAQLGKKPLPEKTVKYLFYKCIFTEGEKIEMSNIDIKAEGSSTISGNAFNSEVKGVLAGGDVSGEVNYSITQLKESNTPYSEELADKLIQLKAIIEEDHYSTLPNVGVQLER